MLALQTTIPALKTAVYNGNRIKNFIFHSDRGVQYACSNFTEFVNKKNIAQSMSRKGDCLDNAVAESFFKSLKVESVHRSVFKSKREARKEVFKYIEIWYNRKRRHSALGYATLLEMDALFNLKKVA